MKRVAIALVMLCLMLGTALAEGPVLLVQLPENAQMVENVAFDDGDFIQSYQLDGGVSVQLLRYGAFDMTLEELAQGEWTGHDTLEALELEKISGFDAEGIRLTHGEASVVYAVKTRVQGQTLLFVAVFPEQMGNEKIEEQINWWLGTMEVSGDTVQEVG